MASKVIKVYSGMLGQDFLINVIGSHVVSICSNSNPSVSFEIDPERISENQNLSENIDYLKKNCQEIFDSIKNSVDATPM